MENTELAFTPKKNQSEQIGELAAALSILQGACDAPPKDKTATIPMKSGGQYKYNYSDLGTVIRTAKPHLSTCGLAISQVISEVAKNAFSLETKLLHKSGQWISSDLPLTIPEDPKALGSLLTYYRRYAICAILGIASEEDDDGDSAIDRSAASKPMVQSKGIAPHLPATEGQIKRVFAVAKACGYSNDDIKEKIKIAYNLESTKDLSWKQTDELCNFFEANKK